ncbi:MAG: beta-lactamase family protein [Lactobacillus sp.]|jgi:CubicO group peptidase (beta-lactamase class C family)|nr:beta-lactamase family protein [Lactobacillus sp.]MCI1482087.1 beta-lactamase family protein [Lactobacillus sp.]
MRNFFNTQQLIEDMVHEKIVPGVNYALISKQQTNRVTLGAASFLPNQQQLSPNAVYDLASLTKVLGTLNVCLQLYQQGKLNFSESVQEFLPDFSDHRVRLFHLLTHTSGIRGWIPHRNRLTADELINAIVHLPVTDEFEKRMRYADTNFILLGLVLEKIYHRPVQSIIQDQILRPMRLTSTSFHPDPQACLPTALVKQEILQGRPHDPKARQLGNYCGSAGLFSTLPDLLVFAGAYLGLNNRLPIKQTLLADLFDIKTNHQVKPRSWGWNLLFDPQYHYPIIYHTGYTGTLLIFDRVRQTGLILLTNRVNPSGHNQVFLAMRKQIINAFLKENCAY